MEIEMDNKILDSNEGDTDLKVGDFVNIIEKNDTNDVMDKNLPYSTSHIPRRQDTPPRGMGGCVDKSSSGLSVDLPVSPIHVRRPLTTFSHGNDQTTNEINANVSEVYLPNNEINDNINFDGYVSEESDTIELDPGDEELLIHRQTKKTSTNSVVKDNSECEREYIYIMCKGISEQMEGLKRQNEALMRDKESFIGNVNTEKILKEKCEIIQEAIQVNNDRVGVALIQVQSTINSNVKEAIGKVQILVREDIARSHDDIKINIDNVQDSLRESLQRELAISHDTLKGHMQDEVNEIKVYIKNDLLNLESNVKNIQEGLQSNVKNIQEGLQNNQDALKGHMKDMTELQSVIEGRILGQTLSLATVSTDVLAAVSGIEGQVQIVGQKVDAFKYDVEIVQADMMQMKFDLFEEIEARCKDKVEVNAKIDTLQAKYEEDKIELLAQIANRDIQVMALQSTVNNFAKEMNEMKRVQTQAQVNFTHLEGVVEANSVQGNVLNDHLHNIESKIDKVGDIIPELLQSTLTQALNKCQGEAATTNFPNTIPARDCPPPPPFHKLANDQEQPTLQRALPSIPSTPLLPENFITPSPPSRQSLPMVQGAVANFRSTRSDHIIADMVKREQKPLFSGDDVSPPVFLQEVEDFFQLVQITEDRDKLQVFPTFLIGNPSGWWKLISGQVTTWRMAKELLLKQYFNDFDKQRYKDEWRNLNFKDFSNVEEFTLRGLTILNTIKTKDTDQKRCERVTIKLPEPLRDYLLNRQFTSTQDFLNQIKEAMMLKNFDSSLYFKSQNYSGNSNGTASSGKNNKGNFKYGKSYNNNNGNNRYNGNNNTNYNKC